MSSHERKMNNMETIYKIFFIENEDLGYREWYQKGALELSIPHQYKKSAFRMQ